MAQLKTRGLMLDLARGMDRKSVYTEMLPWLREWGYNLLHLHLVDDQGCRLVFPRRPELASPGAFSPDEMRQLIAAASDCGIEVVPEIESLGHAGFITRLRQYRHLGGPNPAKEVFNALDPDHPDTRRVLSDVLADTADIFPGPVIHAGLDEVDFARLPRYRGMPRQDQWPLFAAHAAWVHQAIRRLGRRPAMWGDHLLSQRAMAAKFKKDVLIFDWHYRPEVDPASLDFLAGEGFEVWAAPATMYWCIRLLSGPGVFTNVREFAAHACQPQRKRVTGVVNTVWCSWRYLPGAQDWPIAWAGHVLSSAQEQQDYCHTFCRDFYGFTRADAASAAEAILALHELAPDGPRIDAVLGGGVEFTRERVRQCALARPKLSAAVRQLRRLLPAARRHGERLHDVLLSGQLLERWAMLGGGERARLSRSAGKALLEACRARWAVERPYPTPVFPAAGRFQHILKLAARLVEVSPPARSGKAGRKGAGRSVKA